MQSDLPPNGVLVIDKPRGPTSHDIVGRVRRALRTKRVGHGGTLDPMASGVLVVLVGEATKLGSYLTAQHKRYEARVVLGAATATLDADGAITESAALPESLLAAIRALAGTLVPEGSIAAAFEAERARSLQVPPVYSAIHVAGRRSYDLARAGEEVTHEPREVAMRSLELLGAGALPASEEEGTPERAFLDLSVCVSKGYYVRSMARDLGASLGVPAHLGALRRTASGSLSIDAAVRLDAGPDALRAALVPVAEAVRAAMPVGVLGEEGVLKARCGKRLTTADFAAPPPTGAEVSAWLDEAGQLVAIGEAAGDELVVRRGFGQGT